MARLARINLTPVKGLGLNHPRSVALGPAGAEGNRRFYLICAGRLYNGADHGPLVSIAAAFEGERLRLSLPDGSEFEAEIELGERVETDFWGRAVGGRVVEGPWSEALSEFAGAALTLVQSERPGTASDIAVGTLIGRGSCERLAAELRAPIDPRRFRMLLELDGLEQHEEDGWNARLLQVGEAVLVAGGPVPRCVVTTQDPDTGLVSLDPLRAIKRFRGLRDGRYVDFGIYFDVLRAGRVSVGDEVLPL